MLVALEIMLPETAAAMIPAVVRRPQAIPDELPSRARTRVRALLAALTRDWRIERVEPGGDGLTVILGDGVERVTLLIRNGRLIRWTDGNGTHDGSKTTMRRVAGIIENTEP